jgi:hypothetical protein
LFEEKRKKRKEKNCVVLVRSFQLRSNPDKKERKKKKKSRYTLMGEAYMGFSTHSAPVNREGEVLEKRER